MRQLEDRVQELLEANNRLVQINRNLKQQLIENRGWFEFYAEQHRRKNTPEADQKACVNEQRVTNINDCLAANSPT